MDWGLNKTLWQEDSHKIDALKSMCVVENSNFETHEEGSEITRGQLELAVWSAQLDFPISKNIQISSRQITTIFGNPWRFHYEN